MLSRRLVPMVVLPIVLACLGGWGRTGHAVIADIAYRELTPEARAKVDAILAGQTIQETASWADGVRGRNDEFPWTSPLHYANLPADAIRYDDTSMRPPEGNVVSGVTRFAAQLVDAEASELERRQALMFLVHFVGDLHQPLHAGNAEDRGGNDIDISWFGSERRLHSIWDSGIIDAASGEPWPVMGDRLYREVTPQDRLAWTVNDPLPGDSVLGPALVEAAGRWVLESRRFANTHAYRADGFSDGEAFVDGTELGADYAEHCEPVVELRLKQAGVRLGRLLNALLSSPN